MPSLEEYLGKADILAQEIVRVGGANRQAGIPSSRQFLDVFHKACRYLEAKRYADDRHKHYVLTEEDATVKAARQAFAEAYKTFHEKYEPFQLPPD